MRVRVWGGAAAAAAVLPSPKKKRATSGAVSGPSGAPATGYRQLPLHATARIEHIRVHGRGSVNPRFHRLDDDHHHHDDGNGWVARTVLLHTFEQDDIDHEELVIPGCTLVNAEVSDTTEVRKRDGTASLVIVGLRGENLAEDDVRDHTPFKRHEFVYQPRCQCARV